MRRARIVRGLALASVFGLVAAVAVVGGPGASPPVAAGGMGYVIVPADDDDGIVWGDGWPPEVELVVALNGVEVAVVVTDHWGYFHTDLDVAVGDEVMVTDGETVKTHVKTALTFSGVEVTANGAVTTTALGTAEPGTTVIVRVYDEPYPSQSVTAGEDGVWAAHFTGLRPGALAAAFQSNADGHTWWWWNVPWPRVTVDPVRNMVWGYDWPADAEVTVTVDVEPPFEVTVVADDQGDSWTPNFEYTFDVADVVLAAGTTVTATDGVTEKLHVVTTLAVVDADIDTDIVTGTAEPGSEVRVTIRAAHTLRDRTVEVDEHGVWSIDFSVAINCPSDVDPSHCRPEDYSMDFYPGMGGRAYQYDEAGDATHIPWMAYGPPFPPESVVGIPGDGSIEVSWTEPWSPEWTELASEVTGYLVTAHLVSGEATEHTCAWTTGPLTCVVEGLTNGQSYSFTVVAENEFGPGPVSEPSLLVRPRGEEPAPAPFVDIPGEAFYATAVDWAFENRITTGYGGPTVYEPDMTVNRGQMVTFLHRAVDEPMGFPVAGFPDVPLDAFYAAAVDWAFATEVTTGYGQTGYFAPGFGVTRGQMATFLHRMVGLPEGAPPSGFVDVPAEAFYAAAVDWAFEFGITTGYGTPEQYAPNVLVTRGQMATFLHRLATTPEAWALDPLPSVVQA